jgi:predicted secreted protein with PEFG-CTERM motif
MYRDQNNISCAQSIYLKINKYDKVGTIILDKKLGELLLVMIAISVCSSSPVFASPSLSQNSTITTLVTPTISPIGSISVTTDKTSYNDGDKITISGITQDIIVNTPVTVMIVSPMGNIVKIDQVGLAPDRTFSTTITATGTLWQAAGTYDVKVEFGSKDRTANTSFQFSGSTVKAELPISTMKVDGTNFAVKYSIINGKVLGIKADMQAKSLLVSIQTTGDGLLTVALPRALINSTSHDGKDDQYFVLMDAQHTDFDETSTTTTDRTLSIPFTDGTEEIEIIGTQIIPEFGPIAVLVLAIAIISIIAVSARSGLGFSPKY